MTANCEKCLINKDQQIELDDIYSMIRYVPYRLVRSIGEDKCCLFENCVVPLEGAVVYFDISGFTHIVADFIESGKDVALLSEAFCGYYSIIIETVREFAGSVYQFAGDSILVCFDKLENETLEDSCIRALTAMIRARELSSSYNEVIADMNGFSLEAKTGMGCGDFNQILLGRPSRFVTPLLMGSAVSQAVQCEKNCNKNDILVSSSFYEAISKFNLQKFFTAKDSNYLLTKVPKEVIDEIEPPPYFDQEVLFDNPRFYKRVRAFINPLIEHQIKNDFQGFNGEYREITCVMLHFNGMFSKNSTQEELQVGHEHLNILYELIQDKAAKFRGCCITPDLSDKGTVFPILFGVPTVLECKEINALMFANEILKDGLKYDFVTTLSSGISTGVVYSGEFGANMRKDYTIVGNTINLAARLMMQENKSGQVDLFIDEKTFEKVESVCNFSQMSDIVLKGFNTPRKVYQYINKKNQSFRELTKEHIIGRDEELKELQKAYEEAKKGKTVFVPICGDAGVGKSYLIKNFLYKISAEQKQTKIIYSNCYQYEDTTLFYCWRNIVLSLLDIDESLPQEKTYPIVEKYFSKFFSNDRKSLNFFMNMLGYSFVESDELLDEETSNKQLHFFDLVIKLLQAKAKKNPLIIVIDNMQWCDMISLSMLDSFVKANSSSPILFITSFRESDYISIFYQYYKMPIKELTSLNEDSVKLLVSELIDIDESCESLISKIALKSDGNPFFIECIVKELITKNRLVKNENDKYVFSQKINSIDIPQSMKDVILSQLNSLLFTELVICKTASVIGLTFSREALRTLVPEEVSDSDVDKALDVFVEQKIIVRNPVNKDAFTFKHSTIKDVIYNTILESTRKELNGMYLSYLEKRYKDNLINIIDKVILHSQESHNFEKVYKYSLIAAKEAEKKALYKKAAEYCEMALESIDNIEDTTRKPKDDQISIIKRIYHKLKSLKKISI